MTGLSARSRTRLAVGLFVALLAVSCGDSTGDGTPRSTSAASTSSMAGVTSSTTTSVTTIVATSSTSAGVDRRCTNGQAGFSFVVPKGWFTNRAAPGGYATQPACILLHPEVRPGDVALAGPYFSSTRAEPDGYALYARFFREKSLEQWVGDEVRLRTGSSSRVTVDARGVTFDPPVPGVTASHRSAAATQSFEAVRGRIPVKIPDLGRPAGSEIDFLVIRGPAGGVLVFERFDRITSDEEIERALTELLQTLAFS